MNSAPKITIEEYRQRRRRVFDQMAENSIAVLPTATEKVRSADGYYPFQADRDFYYLTGFNEPEAIAVLIKAKENRFILFNRAKNPQQEQWLGHFSGQSGAINDYAADASYPYQEFEQRLPELLYDKEHLYFPWKSDNTIQNILMRHIDAIKQKSRFGLIAPTTTHNLAPIIHELRLFKSQAEIEMMAYAAEISSKAHLAMMRACRPGKFEYQLQAELSYVLQQHGCLQYAYDPIIAGAENACTLHYCRNGSLLNDGDLVLIDAAGEYHYYAADITRTFPVNGVFSAQQKQLYTIVLQAQTAGMRCLKPGYTHHDFNQAIAKTITEGLLDLGILSGDAETLLAEKAYRAFYPHSGGHWLGLDVHDVGDYHLQTKAREFMPGMVISNEPGIYIPHGQHNVDAQWQGIGIRIEDMVVITETEPRVLSANLPKTVTEIEAFMANQ
ncbi:MAG: aminopeptidase P N-terminal domain-containing protein [Pseudomonadota bacterium]